VKLIVYII